MAVHIKTPYVVYYKPHEYMFTEPTIIEHNPSPVADTNWSIWGGDSVTFAELRKKLHDNGVSCIYGDTAIVSLYYKGEWLNYRLHPNRITRVGISSVVTRAEIEFLNLVKEYYFD